MNEIDITKPSQILNLKQYWRIVDNLREGLFQIIDLKNMCFQSGFFSGSAKQVAVKKFAENFDHWKILERFKSKFIQNGLMLYDQNLHG